jgi:hypothetical protein
MKVHHVLICVDIAYEDDEAPKGRLTDDEYHDLLDDELRDRNYELVGVIIR